MSRAERLLKLGESVILDASWSAAVYRHLAAQAADRTHAELVEMRCDVPESVAAERLSHRLPGPSDANGAIATAKAADAAPWPEAAAIDTSGPSEKAVEAALAVIRPR